jgi:hypothetical protein
MNANRRPAKKPSAQEIRRSKAAQARSRRALAEFKKFVHSTIRDLERDREMLVILQVVHNPSSPGPHIDSDIIHGPPYSNIQQ